MSKVKEAKNLAVFFHILSHLLHLVDLLTETKLLFVLLFCSCLIHIL
jgi:hypothetical protein